MSTYEQCKSVFAASGKASVTIGQATCRTDPGCIHSCRHPAVEEPIQLRQVLYDGPKSLTMSGRNVIFQPGVKYVLRHYFTIAGVAGAFGCGLAYAGYQGISWSLTKSENSQKAEK